MTRLRFCVLASGSKGNAAFLSTPHAQVLVDCGIGPRALASALAPLGAHPGQLDAVFISHTHSDHVSGLGLLLKQNPRLRVYAPAPHVPKLRDILAGTSWPEIVPVTAQEGFFHRDIDVLPVEVAHDCPPTLMYLLHVGESRIGVLTDLGEVTAQQAQLFGSCDVLVLEANHCRRMLATGPYPEDLKRRIASRLGHLSNDQSYHFAAGLARLPRLFLGHLSDENNSAAAASAAFGAPVPNSALAWQRPQGDLALDGVEAGSPGSDGADGRGMQAAGWREHIPHTVIVQRTIGPVVDL